jgi:FixJ family two-component response regulator
MDDGRPVVYVIDDDLSIRAALRRLLLSVDLDAQLFSSSREFLTTKLPDVPSCLILDVRLPEVSGLDLQQQLIAKNVSLPIVFLTGYGDIPMTVKAMKAGAVEFLTKPFRDQDLLDAVYRAIQQDRGAKAQQKALSVLTDRYSSLTSREKDVLPLLVSGLLNKQIAAQLGTSEKTIKRHRSELMKKMKANSVADLVKMAELLRDSPQSPIP